MYTDAFHVYLLPALFGLIGLVLGSFGNVLIARLPTDVSIGGRSKCPYCGRILPPRELIPVLSYLLLEGRCAGCKRRISVQYPMVEIASTLLFITAFYLFPFDILSAGLMAVGLWALLLIAVTDARTQSIPDILSIIVGLCGVLLHFIQGDIGVIAPLIGLGWFGAQWLLSRGTWVGSGDIILAVAMGFFVGTWQLMLVALMLAYVTGAAWVTGMLLMGNTKPGQSVAFGPFLVLGTLIASLWGNQILGFLF